MLSGESLPVSKRPYQAGADAEDPAHWVAAGTRLLAGTARIRIAYTGAETLYGEIVRLTVQGTQARTPLQQAITGLVSKLLVAALVLCVGALVSQWGWIAVGTGPNVAPPPALTARHPRFRPQTSALIPSVNPTRTAGPQDLPTTAVTWIALGVDA